ncbi:DUF7713 domain-containing protein [Indiicoccus explosivorum]|uniref:DUF7713 domain-containing protein n=1 Tax=Indiicoccus explosivorum TaxID=1917864 RepID=UPI000B443AB3|nr:hypothetical protein [Indiicoccus explosivorum]
MRWGSEKVKVILTKETESEALCLRCYNGWMTEELGVEAESYPEKISIRDSEGTLRDFEVEKKLDPIGVIMEAREVGGMGYEFTLAGDLDEDQGQLLLELIEKVKRGMAETYIRTGNFPNGQCYHILKADRMAGRIAYDDENEGAPLIVIDGTTYSWDEIGKLLMSYEGFQFKLEVMDRFEEIEWADEREEKR